MLARQRSIHTPNTYRRQTLVTLASLPLALRLGSGIAATQELRIGMSGDVTTVDPHWLNTGPNIAVARHVFDALIEPDPQGRYKPSLAESWKLVDPVTWEFKLKRGVQWHDGTELTAADVLFSLERPKQLTGTPSGFASFVRGVERMRAVDSHTVRITTSMPNNAWLPQDLSNVMIVQKRVAENSTAQADWDNGRATIGTGPYKLARFNRGDRIELVRHDKYWGGPLRLQPVFERVTLRMLTQDAPRIAALLAGDVDAVENIPVQDIKRIRSTASLRTVEQVSWRTLFFHMDQSRDISPFISDKNGKPLTKNPFKDPRVRLAFDKAINRQALVDRVMEGLAKPSANLMAPGTFGHNPDLKPEPYDPDGAKKLLSEAGYPNGFALVMHGPNNRYINDEQVAQAVASMLSRIGVNVRVETMPSSTYFARANKSEFSFNLIGWGSLSGDSSMRYQFATQDEKEGWGSWNNGRGSYPELDALLRKARATPDDNAREALAREAAAVILKNRQAIFLYHQVVSWAMRKDISFPGRVDEMTMGNMFTSVGKS
ncbi:MAG TPA: ABC transporter substrate-binding protein [Burkholderiaceae bacterium]|nr:ABC transporter substrate-binding protein [Burkholderiaceae bacterium]